MADIVKCIVRKSVVIKVGDRVSVSRNHFDNPNEKVEDHCSSYLHPSYNVILGTVSVIFSGDRYKVNWDIDDSTSIAKGTDLNKEKIDITSQ